MSDEPLDENEEIPPPLNLDALNVEDVSMPSHGIPNVKASKPKKNWFTGAPAGDKRETAKKTTTRKSTVPRRKGMFVQPLTQMYVGLGMILMPVDPVCANAVMQSAENCARTLDELAYQNDAVRRALFAITQTSAVGAVIFAHLPILAAVMMHHVPAVQNVMGVMGQQMAESIINQTQSTPKPDSPDNE